MTRARKLPIHEHTWQNAPNRSPSVGLWHIHIWSAIRPHLSHPTAILRGGSNVAMCGCLRGFIRDVHLAIRLAIEYNGLRATPYNCARRWHVSARLTRRAELGNLIAIFFE